MAIVFVNGSFSNLSNSATASLSNISVTHNTVSFTATFVNNSNVNVHTWVIEGSSGIGQSAGSVPTGSTITRNRSFNVGESQSGFVSITKFSAAGNPLGSAFFNFQTGFSYDDTPAPPPTPAPSFTDTTVANGLLGVSYSDAVSANNTSSYAIASGSLPPGLSFNTSSGAITGTPTQQGSFTFAITASGGGGSTGSGNLTIQIFPAGNRRNDVGFDVNLANAKRYDGTNWINLSNMKRFDGTNWINISN